MIPPRSSKRTSTQKAVVDREEAKVAGGLDGAGVSGAEESNEVTREMKLEFVMKIKKLTN